MNHRILKVCLLLVVLIDTNFLSLGKGRLITVPAELDSKPGAPMSFEAWDGFTRVHIFDRDQHLVEIDELINLLRANGAPEARSEAVSENAFNLWHHQEPLEYEEFIRDTPSRR